MDRFRRSQTWPGVGVPAPRMYGRAGDGAVCTHVRLPRPAPAYLRSAGEGRRRRPALRRGRHRPDRGDRGQHGSGGAGVVRRALRPFHNLVHDPRAGVGGAVHRRARPAPVDLRLPAPAELSSGCRGTVPGVAHRDHRPAGDPPVLPAVPDSRGSAGGAGPASGALPAPAQAHPLHPFGHDHGRGGARAPPRVAGGGVPHRLAADGGLHPDVLPGVESATGGVPQHLVLHVVGGRHAHHHRLRRRVSGDQLGPAVERHHRHPGHRAGGAAHGHHQLRVRRGTGAHKGRRRRRSRHPRGRGTGTGTPARARGGAVCPHCGQPLDAPPEQG